MSPFPKRDCCYFFQTRDRLPLGFRSDRTLGGLAKLTGQLSKTDDSMGCESQSYDYRSTESRGKQGRHDHRSKR